MVFKKPYAFFIKYFRIINLILAVLMTFFVYRLNLLHQALNNLFLGNLTNYSNLEADFIGFKMYLLLFITSIIIIAIILTLKRKKKPFRDYLFNIIYNIFIIAYFFAISNLFLTLNETVVELTSLKLYSDISLLIIAPLLYFIVKYLLIVIGFDLKKFNFAKDIIELKQDAEDNEEVEVDFNKNTYKVKRRIRKYLRELKYYILENKMFISIILGFLFFIGLAVLFSLNIFNSTKVNKNKFFNAGGFSYKVTNIVETKFDSNYKLVKDDSKFVIMTVNVRNNSSLGATIDYKRIRLLFGDEYVYSNNFFNDNFYDLGTPYNNEVLKSGELYEFIFIFKVPDNYKSNKYILKFYDRLTVEEDETIGSYKELHFTSTNFDKKREEKHLNLNENIVFNKKKYGNSNITLTKYSIENSYVYKRDDKTFVIRDKDVNKLLLIVDYKLIIDDKSVLSHYFQTDKAFFKEFISLQYLYNGKSKEISNLSIVDIVDDKVMISIPYQVKDSEHLNLIFNLRERRIIYKLK